MSLTALPSGFQPAYHRSGQLRSVAHPGILLPGTNVNIFKNKSVYLAIGTGATVNGVTVPAGQVYLAPVVTTTQAIWGVFAGCEYFDVTGAPQEANSWIAGTVVYPGTVITAFIWEDPEIVYTAQTDGALTAATTLGDGYSRFDGREINESNFAAGSVTVGLSQSTLGASTLVATTVQGQWQIEKLDPTILNQSPGDPFVQLQVSVARSQVAAPSPSI